MSARAESYRLSKRGEAGLACDLQGVALGPVVLVEKTGEGVLAQYRRRPLGEIEKALNLAYGKASATDLAETLSGLDAAARALNRRRLFDATLAASRMKLQPLSPQAVTKLLAAPGFRQVPLAKAFNPDQPRIPAGNPDGGQWGDGEGGARPAASATHPVPAPDRSTPTVAPAQPAMPAGVQYAQNTLGNTVISDVSSGANSSLDWRNAISKPGKISQQNWDDFKQALANMPQLSNLQRQAFLESRAFEAGQDPAGTAFAGLRQSVVNEAIEQGAITGAPYNTAPKNLTATQIVQGYRYYVDTTLSRVGGFSALEQFNDPRTAMAVADTLFRGGRSGGAVLLAGAVNAVLSQLSDSFRQGLGLSDLPSDPNSVGPQTLNALTTLSNGGLGLQLRDDLATLRTQRYKNENPVGEKARADYFR